MALILLCSNVWRRFRTRERNHAVRHQNSVFHAITKHVPWGAFDRLVDEHGADTRVRQLTTKSQLLALLYGQLAGAASLREIVGGLESHAARLYHLGARAASRSTLSDANALRTGEVFRACSRGWSAQAIAACASDARAAASDRFDQLAVERAVGRLGAVLGQGLRRQGARRLRSGRRPAALCRGHRGQGQRHHRRQGDADRAGRDLRLRSRLLRLRLVGQARRRRMPHRHPVQDQHATCPVSSRTPSPKARTSCPTASAICRRGTPPAARTPSPIPFARSG